MIEAACTALLSRGVQPDVIRDMSSKELSFWVERHNDLARAEQDAASR